MINTNYCATIQLSRASWFLWSCSYQLEWYSSHNSRMLKKAFRLHVRSIAYQFSKCLALLDGTKEGTLSNCHIL